MHYADLWVIRLHSLYWIFHLALVLSMAVLTVWGENVFGVLWAVPYTRIVLTVCGSSGNALASLSLLHIILNV